MLAFCTNCCLRLEPCESVHEEKHPEKALPILLQKKKKSDLQQSCKTWFAQELCVPRNCVPSVRQRIVLRLIQFGPSPCNSPVGDSVPFPCSILLMQGSIHVSKSQVAGGLAPNGRLETAERLRFFLDLATHQFNPVSGL